MKGSYTKFFRHKNDFLLIKDLILKIFKADKGIRIICQCVNAGKNFSFYCNTAICGKRWQKRTWGDMPILPEKVEGKGFKVYG